MKINQATKSILLLLLALSLTSCSLEQTVFAKPAANISVEQTSAKGSESMREKRGSNAKLITDKNIFQIQQIAEQSLIKITLTGDEFIQDKTLFDESNLIMDGLPEGASFRLAAVTPTQLLFQVTHTNLSILGQYRIDITLAEAVFKESIEPVTSEVTLLYGNFDTQYQFETVAGYATVPRLDGLQLTDTLELISPPSAGILTDGASIMGKGEMISVDALNTGTLFYKSRLDHEWYGSHEMDALIFKSSATEETILIQYSIENPTASQLPTVPNAWFDASARNSLMVEYGVFAEAGEQLSLWRDHSANNIIANVPEGSTRPFYSRQAFLDGYEMPSVTFDNVSDRLERELGIEKQDGESAYSYVGAFQLNEPNVAHSMHSLVSANNGRGGLFVADDFVASRNFNGNESFITGTDSLATEWFVASNSNSSDGFVGHRLFLNGRLQAHDKTYPDITDFSMLTLGDAQTSVEQSFLGNMGEVLFFDAHLSDYELMKVDEYLTLRWGNGRLNDARNAQASVNINATFLTGRHFIYDSPFDDMILGSQQNDTIYTHDGDDFIAGNFGANRIVFMGDGHKTISDFDATVDTLDFSQLINFRQAANVLNYFQITESDKETVIRFDPNGQAKFADATLQITLIGAQNFDTSAISPAFP